MQLAQLRLDNALALVTVPLTTVAFLSILRQAGRTDLEPYAVLAPMIIGLFTMALQVSGEIIAGERDGGTFEALLATPAPVGVVVTSRIVVVTAVSLVSLVESWLVGVLFGVDLRIFHPWLFVVVLLVTAAATAGSAVIMAAVFVIARSARTFQNALSYPAVLLGGALVPVALLPEWAQPIARLVFLSWASDLLRDCFGSAPVEAADQRLLVLIGLGTASWGAGLVLLDRLVDRTRATGSAGLS